MCKAMNVAGWFIKNDFDAPNSKDGNLKLNKLLYFAQMISLSRRRKPLFDENLYAFKNGVVVEDIRQEYCNRYSQFIEEANSSEYNFNDEEVDILNITKRLFMDVSPKDLSMLTHEHECWKDYYNRSRKYATEGYDYNKKESIIPVDKILDCYQCDLNLVSEMVDALEPTEQVEEAKLCINNIEFYYDPSKVKIDDNIKEQLREFPAEDDVYSFYIDDSQGLVIY